MGGRLCALVFGPVVGAVGAESARDRGAGATQIIRWLHDIYEAALPWILSRRKLVLGLGVGVLVGALLIASALGGEFMPKLEEGNLWVRATLPVDISFEASSRLAGAIRETLRGFPVVNHVVSQMGRPDDGTDVTTFNNSEYFVILKPRGEWPGGLPKENLVRRCGAKPNAFPGARVR